jgi:glycerate 2-kinase
LLNPLSGPGVTRYCYSAPCRPIEIAAPLLQTVDDLSANDLVLCMISGSGSSLRTLPLPDLTLAAEQTLTQALLASGNRISEMISLRRHQSAIKSEHLAVACIRYKLSIYCSPRCLVMIQPILPQGPP